MHVSKSIDEMIQELIGQLPQADDVESARIHTRIAELRALEKEHVVTT